MTHLKEPFTFLYSCCYMMMTAVKGWVMNIIILTDDHPDDYHITTPHDSSPQHVYHEDVNCCRTSLFSSYHHFVRW